MLGEQPDSIDALPAPILGRPVDEVKKAYKDELAPGKDFALMLAPTEWERVGTRVALAQHDGKIRELSFSLPYKPHPEARDRLLDLFKQKWGEPKDLDDGKAMLFHDSDPRVEIKDDTEHGAWIVELR